MDEQDLNYISVPRSEWTDDTADLAIKIIEMETGKNPGKKFHKKRNKNKLYNRNL